jgi:hypothetical protein
MYNNKCIIYNEKYTDKKSIKMFGLMKTDVGINNNIFGWDYSGKVL